MKTKILTSLLISAMLSIGSINAHTKKKLKTIDKTTIEFNVANFCNYLENGNSNGVEGIYKSPNGKYVFALVKNDESNHDFIGVVLASKNNRWKEGEIKFNFMLNKDTLVGYYYDDKGNPIPVEFAMESDTLKTNVLTKVDLQKIKAGTLAYFRKK